MDIFNKKLLKEKKAIEFFEKSFKKKIPPYWYDNTISNIEEKIKIILNLIEKQQKEIDHWKKGIEIVDKDHKNYINKQYNKILEKEEIIEKQNKIIDKMADNIFNIIDYFTNKVDKEGR